MKCQEKSSSKRYLLSPSGLRAWIWLKWKGLRPGTEQFSRAFTKLVHLVRESRLHTRPTRENISCDSKNIIDSINWCNVDQDAVIVE